MCQKNVKAHVHDPIPLVYISYSYKMKCLIKITCTMEFNSFFCINIIHFVFPKTEACLLHSYTISSKIGPHIYIRNFITFINVRSFNNRETCQHLVSMDATPTTPPLIVCREYMTRALVKGTLS